MQVQGSTASVKICFTMIEFVLHDFLDARMCFSNVEIKGGVQFLLWSKNYHGNCNIVTHHENGTTTKSFRPLLEPGLDNFVRNSNMISILKKVRAHDETPFSTVISSRDPFGYDIRLPGSFKVAKHKFALEKSIENDIEFYYNGWRKDGVGYVSSSSVNSNQSWVDCVKILIPKAWGTGDETKDWLNPFIVNPPSVCTETYLVVGPFESEATANNVMSYMKTKFFHIMVSVLKISQNAAKGVYDAVPMQDFSREWTDMELYQKYGLDKDEIAYIEETIKEMQ